MIVIDRDKLIDTLTQFFPPPVLEGVTAETLFKQIITDIRNEPFTVITANQPRIREVEVTFSDGKKHRLVSDEQTKMFYGSAITHYAAKYIGWSWKEDEDEAANS